MGEFIKVAGTKDLAPGKAMQVVVNGKEIALFNLNGEFCALANECTHAGGPLCEGFIDAEEVTCPWHGAMFNIRSGEVLGPPAGEAVERYNVRLNGNDVEVEV